MSERVDLDRYAAPNRDAETLTARRVALLDQLGWLGDEAVALLPHLDRLPTWAVEEAPAEGERSLRAVLNRLAWLDQEVRPAWLHALSAPGSSALTTPEQPSDADSSEPVAGLVARLRTAREALVALFATLEASDWDAPLTLDGREMDVYGLALAIVQHDADELRTLAYRMYEADLSSRPQG